MRPRSNLEYLGNLVVVLATVISLALLSLAGAFKIGSAELIAQVLVLQDPSTAAPRGWPCASSCDERTREVARTGRTSLATWGRRPLFA